MKTIYILYKSYFYPTNSNESRPIIDGIFEDRNDAIAAKNRSTTENDMFYFIEPEILYLAHNKEG